MILAAEITFMFHDNLLYRSYIETMFYFITRQACNSLAYILFRVGGTFGDHYVTFLKPL